VKHLAAACVIIVLLFCGSPSSANDSTDSRKDRSSKIATLAREYRELRVKRRQLAPGMRLKELDDSGGKLEETLSALGVELGHPPHTRKTVIALLEQRDAILDHRKMRKYLGVYYRDRRKISDEVDQRRDRKYLIYFWRGWHDFLFFISEEGVIVDHGWWFAYE
jgi:hypothetical protein